MKRRALMAPLLGAFAAAAITAGSCAAREYRLGLMMAAGPDCADAQPTIARAETELLLGLREAGRHQADQVGFTWRCFQRTDDLDAMARELVALGPDALLGNNGPAVQALKRATRRIPILFGGVSDPVGFGLVDSLARPGGNVTGVSLMFGEVTAKRLQIVTELVPGVQKVGWLRDDLGPAGEQAAPALTAAAQKLGVALHSFVVSKPEGLAEAFAAMAESGIGGLLVETTPLIWAWRQRVTALAAERRLPAVYASALFSEAGGLISYSADPWKLTRRVGAMLDGVLNGSDPAELPVEQPTHFELVVNLRTAKQLGITFPPSILARADQVIE